jgi:hypothetical protein
MRTQTRSAAASGVRPFSKRPLGAEYSDEALGAAEALLLDLSPLRPYARVDPSCAPKGLVNDSNPAAHAGHHGCVAGDGLSGIGFGSNSEGFRSLGERDRLVVADRGDVEGGPEQRQLAPDRVEHGGPTYAGGIGDGLNRRAEIALLDEIQALEDCGYEPRVDSSGVTLVNCPFHSLAQEYTDLVCGINLDLIHGMLSCLDRAGFEATLEPAPGRCCVRLQNV